MEADAQDAQGRTRRPGGAPFIDRLPRSVIDRYVQEHPDHGVEGLWGPAECLDFDISRETACHIRKSGLRALALLPDGQCVLADICDIRPAPTVVIADGSGQVVTPVPIVRALSDFPGSVAFDDEESEAYLAALADAHPALLVDVLELLRQTL